jgi:hypothetical protein
MDERLCRCLIHLGLGRVGWKYSVERAPVKEGDKVLEDATIHPYIVDGIIIMINSIYIYIY